MNSQQYWASLPSEGKNKILGNVWCGSCQKSVKIENFSIKSQEPGVLLAGQCSKCKNKVQRYVEGESS